MNELWRRILSLFRRSALDRDLDDELDAHIQMAMEEKVRAGLDPERARREALIQLGGIEQAKEGHRDARGLPLLDALFQDLRFAVRTLRRDVNFTLVAVLILGLGIGANTAVFSVVNTVLLRPLPFQDPGRLVWMEIPRGDALKAYPVPVFEAFQRHNRSFQQLTGYNAYFGFGTTTLTGRGEPERLVGVDVAQNFFDTLGVRPGIGRFFLPVESAHKGPLAVVLSHGFWERRFLADPAIVGQTLMLNDRPTTVVGVLPATFDFASVFAPGSRVDLIYPAVFEDMREWGNVLLGIGRLRPGVTLAEAQAELDILGPELSQADRRWGSNYIARLSDLKEHVSGSIRRALLVLWAAVLAVLLIVCANLSNLLLARGANRSKELAVRAALGAGRRRLIRQLITESAALSLTGAVLGIAVAEILTRYLGASTNLSLPLLSGLRVDLAALGFTILLALATGIVAGAIPAARISRFTLQEALNEVGRGTTEGRRHGWVRSALVVSEVALAFVLLVGAGLLLRSFVRLLDVDLGFQPSRAAALRVQAKLYSTPPQAMAYYREIRQRVGALPGIEAAGLSDALPLDRTRTWGIRAKGRVYREDERPTGMLHVVSPGYLSAMGIPLRAGRDFDDHDRSPRQGGERVILINETGARQLWPGQDALGKIVLTGMPDEYRVVGIVADVRQSRLEESDGVQFYLCMNQQPPLSPDLVVRTTLPPSAMASSVRAALREIDPNLPASDFRPIQQLIERAVSRRRFLVSLLAVFASLAVILASLGIYGVISYSVSQRAQEIAIRMALGATAAGVQRSVIRGTLRLALAGIGLGLSISLALAPLIASLLFGITASDPLTFAAIVVAIPIVALAAGYFPARRASRIDPMSALRAS